MTKRYAVDDEDGNRLTAGLAENIAEGIAQNIANRMGNPVYLYEMGEGEESGESVEVRPDNVPDTCHACGNIMGLCTCVHPLMWKVAEALVEKGYNAAYEYPGYCGVTLPDGRVANFGTANVYVGADWLESDEPINFFMPETSTCADVVAAIEGWITTQLLTPIAKDILKNVMAAMEAAEGMYAPDDYAPLMEAIVFDCKQRIVTYRSNGGVQ